MFNANDCPVTHVSLFRKLQGLVSSGELVTQDIYRLGFGQGQKYVYNGTPVQYRMGFSGRLDWLDNPPADLDPTSNYDFAYVGRNLISYAKSL